MGRHRYHPKAVKQRLRYNGQLIGCTDTCFAVGVDGTTLGGCRVTEAEVRRLSNETKPDPKSPGLNLTQLRDVAVKLNIDFGVMTGGTWSQLHEALDQNALVVAQLWYSEIGGSAIGHAVLLDQIRGARVRVMDPMKGTWDWHSVASVREAMQKFARMTGVPEGLRWGSFRRAPWLADDQSPQREGDRE